jgi:hypothetical protein
LQLLECDDIGAITRGVSCMDMEVDDCHKVC